MGEAMKPRVEILIDEDGDVDVRVRAMNDREEKAVLDIYERVSHLVDGLQFVLSGDLEC